MVSRDGDMLALHMTHGLDARFHCFFVRNFWFAGLARAKLAFPGGFGTPDEVSNFDALVRHGTIGAGDLKLFRRTDSFDFVTRGLAEFSLDNPGPTL